MRTPLLVVFLVFISGQICGQAVDTLQRNQHYYYLSHLNLKEFGRLILIDSISPSDNPITFRSMDSVMSENKEVRDYYFPVFQKIVEKADGALSEVIGAYVLGYVKKYPKEFSDRYTCCSKMKKCCDEVVKLASFAGEEIMMREDSKGEYEDLLVQITRSFKRWKSDTQLEIFMRQVETTRLNWKN